MSQGIDRGSGMDPGRGPGFDLLRTEGWIALTRLMVVSIVIAIYVASGLQSSSGPLALALLLLTLGYSAWAFSGLGGTREPSPLTRLLVLFLDLALVSAWVLVTGGATSDYWALYLIVVVSAGMRFDLFGTMGVAVGTALFYGALVVADGGLPRELVMHRTSLMIITGFAVGMLSQQRLEHHRRSIDLRAEVTEHVHELSVERAEVERLRRVDLAKSEFVAVAAHEFRTPLAAVIGVLSTLREHGSVLTPEERLELIDGATAQANRLARLVDDLLTVSRIEDGVLRLAFEAVDPRHLLSEAAQVSGMVGRLVIRVGRVGRVRCDQDAIIRVLTNLLDNARKYSPPDSMVHIDVSREDGRIRFRIGDEGPGIPEGERGEIFERFRRLDGGKAKPGAGLGLYICRGLVEAHGGTIGADVSRQGGAELSFTLPAATRADEEAPTAEPLTAIQIAPDGGPARPLEVAVPVEDLPPAAVR